MCSSRCRKAHFSVWRYTKRARRSIDYTWTAAAEQRRSPINAAGGALDVDRRRPVAFRRIHGGGCNVGPLRTAFKRLDAQFDARLGRGGVLGMALALGLFSLDARSRGCRAGPRRASIRSIAPRHGANLEGSVGVPDLRDVSTRRGRILLGHGQNARDHSIRAKSASHSNLFSRADRCARRFVMSRSHGKHGASPGRQHGEPGSWTHSVH